MNFSNKRRRVFHFSEFIGRSSPCQDQSMKRSDQSKQSHGNQEMIKKVVTSHNTCKRQREGGIRTGTIGPVYNCLPSGDQTGCLLLPRFVSWKGCCPAAFMINIWCDPSTIDSKAMLPPVAARAWAACGIKVLLIMVPTSTVCFKYLIIWLVISENSCEKPQQDLYCIFNVNIHATMVDKTKHLLCTTMAVR